MKYSKRLYDISILSIYHFHVVEEKIKCQVKVLQNCIYLSECSYFLNLVCSSTVPMSICYTDFSFMFVLTVIVVISLAVISVFLSSIVSLCMNSLFL